MTKLYKKNGAVFIPSECMEKNYKRAIGEGDK